MDLILAFSLQDQVEKYGAYVGLAAFLGLAVLSLLYFAQARELKRLRDWAGRAPERALELEARVVAQAEEALREAESETAEPSEAVAKPAAVAAGGNGAAIPMGPRPAVALAAAAAAQATVEAPAVPASTDGDVPPAEDERAAVVVGDESATVDGEADERVAVPVGDGSAAPLVDTGEGEQAAVPAEEVPPPVDEDRAAAAPADDGEAAPAGEDAGPEPAPSAEDEEPEPARSGNGVPATPPTQIPRATPRPQPGPATAAAALRASTPSRPVTEPPGGTASRRAEREGGSRVVLYTVLGIVVLAVAVFVPVYFMVLNDSDDPTPQPNPIAEPGGSQSTASGAGTQASEARPEKVVVVLNGTPVDGLASGERDKLLAAGYSDEQGMIRTDNNQDQQCQDSVVYYGAEERRQARDVSRLLDITRTEQIDEETQALADSSDQSGSQPADVVALVCADKSP
jgi:hypothetical protein